MRIIKPAMTGLLLALFLTGPALSAGENTYESRHGFKIDYPEGWRLATYMDIYPTLREAERVGGNYFQIMNYPEDDPGIDNPRVFPKDTLKIEAWVYPVYHGTLGQLITQTKGVTKLENFTIDGKKAKKVWRRIDKGMFEGEEALSVYFVDNGKKVIFVCYPTYTSLSKEFDRIVGSFRFE